MLPLALCLAVPSASAGDKRGSSDKGASRSTGALGRATGAVRQTQRSSDQGRSAPTPERGRGVDYPRYNDGYVGCYTCPVIIPTARRSSGPSAHAPALHVQLEISLAVQTVADSDGALAGGVGLRSGQVGLELAGRHYFESGLAQDGSDVIHMNVWSLTAAAQLLGDKRAQLWVHAGVAGISSSEFESELGATFGATIDYALSSWLGLASDARYYLLAEDLRAGEVQAAVELSILRVGYRAFRFNVGPPLHGPEAGMRLRF
ncbi:MAG: hypothetical protein Tsb0020_23660 [Haliangiales bacterium]